LLAAVGAFLRLRADSLATNWQSLGEGAWGGTTDPAVRHSYEVVGMVLLVFGLLFVTLAVARWLLAKCPNVHSSLFQGSRRARQPE
jgi:hypothetical protein